MFCDKCSSSCITRCLFIIIFHYLIVFFRKIYVFSLFNFYIQQEMRLSLVKDFQIRIEVLRISTIGF